MQRYNNYKDLAAEKRESARLLCVRNLAVRVWTVCKEHKKGNKLVSLEAANLCS